ncbi:hypothetical protein VP01_3228g3 [Puccinia sorghi]|uniref:Uncharacterized protein n=1 Tax=Puccinia sorghi TaxID=27349 RepID=A0A0L6UY64_9BASI|nr:hypothetical protein VP01_3228g3 [Puccinia sorghi]
MFKKIVILRALHLWARLGILGLRIAVLFVTARLFGLLLLTANMLAVSVLPWLGMRAVDLVTILSFSTTVFFSADSVAGVLFSVIIHIRMSHYELWPVDHVGTHLDVALACCSSTGSFCLRILGWTGALLHGILGWTGALFFTAFWPGGELIFWNFSTVSARRFLDWKLGKAMVQGFNCAGAKLEVAEVHRLTIVRENSMTRAELLGGSAIHRTTVSLSWLSRKHIFLRITEQLTSATSHLAFFYVALTLETWGAHRCLRLFRQVRPLTSLVTPQSTLVRIPMTPACPARALLWAALLGVLTVQAVLGACRLCRPEHATEVSMTPATCGLSWGCPVQGHVHGYCYSDVMKIRYRCTSCFGEWEETVPQTTTNVKGIFVTTQQSIKIISDSNYANIENFQHHIFVTAQKLHQNYFRFQLLQYYSPLASHLGLAMQNFLFISCYMSYHTQHYNNYSQFPTSYLINHTTFHHNYFRFTFPQPKINDSFDLRYLILSSKFTISPWNELISKKFIRNCLRHYIYTFSIQYPLLAFYLNFLFSVCIYFLKICVLSLPLYGQPAFVCDLVCIHNLVNPRLCLMSIPTLLGGILPHANIPFHKPILNH